MGKSRVILPRKLSVDPRKMAQAIQNTMTNVAKNIKVDFDVTAQTWKDKPTFAITSPTAYSREIATDHDVYTMLNEGTKAHDIRPKGKVLVFRTPFRSKTVPRQISSSAGSTGANQVFTRRPIHHPGTTAREWDTVIAEKWDRQFATIMQRAIDAAVD